MRVFFSDRHDLTLPPGHRFPGHKYGALRRTLIAENVIGEGELSASPIAHVDDVLIAHGADYVSAIETGDIDPAAMRRIGFPWSAAIPLRARATVGGAMAAARRALVDGVSGQLAGGTHHAHRDFGTGYCVYNDFAVAALSLLNSGDVGRVAIVDLDVHQGDGNTAILGGNPDVFVYSVHGEKNFPFRKQKSDLDVALPDGTGDAAYLDALEETLPDVFAFRPDIVLYQAGVDPLKEDALGRMALSHQGLLARDRLVFSECAMRGVPVSIAIGGGYAKPIDPTVSAYVNTWRAAREVFRI